MANKLPKVKIPKQDLKHFTMQDMVVDAYWLDLYNPQKGKPMVKRLV